jgi:hypothetical protein
VPGEISLVVQLQEIRLKNWTTESVNSCLGLHRQSHLVSQATHQFPFARTLENSAAPTR